jgi:hypothetical protein
LDPEKVLVLTDKGRGLYEDLVRRVQDPRDDPELPGLEPNYLIKAGTSYYLACRQLDRVQGTAPGISTSCLLAVPTYWELVLRFRICATSIV